MEELGLSMGACLDHPDRRGTPCSRCGTFRCDECLTGGRCAPCNQTTGQRAPTTEDTVGFGPRAGARIIDMVVGFIGGIIGGIGAGITLAILQGAGIAQPGWVGRLSHGFGFNMLSGLTAGLVGASLSTWVCGASLGKIFLGLRVVQIDGASAGLGAAFLREVGYLGDAFFFGLVGKAAMESSTLQQRHGDRWADTVVVRKASLPAEVLAPGGKTAAGVVMGLAAHAVVIALFLIIPAL